MASATTGGSTLRRIVVGLKSHENSDKIVLAKFVDCIVNHFVPNEVSVKVSCKLQDNTFVLFPPTNSVEHLPCIKYNSLKLEGTNLASSLDLGSVILQHSPECPLWRLPESLDDVQLSENALNQGVYVGVAVVVESSDSLILLTQRPDHMRAFPRAWVPPGGHLEEGETLIQAGFRELEEETGLKFDSSNSSASLLCMWESVYPVLLGIGPPKNHHIVVYLHIKATESWEKLHDRIELDPNEVQACTWLSEGDVRRLFANRNERTAIVNKYVSGPDGLGLAQSELDLSKMFPISLWQDGKVYSGTQMALYRWLELAEHANGHANFLPCKI